MSTTLDYYKRKYERALYRELKVIEENCDRKIARDGAGVYYPRLL